MNELVFEVTQAGSGWRILRGMSIGKYSPERWAFTWTRLSRGGDVDERGNLFDQPGFPG